MRDNCPDCDSSSGFQEFPDHTYCHSCHTYTQTQVKEEFWNKYFPSDLPKAAPGELALPRTVTPRMEKAAMKLLLKAGITEDMWPTYQLLYVDYAKVLDNNGKEVLLNRRIIIPHYTLHECGRTVLDSYQARSTNSYDKPKYLTFGAKSVYDLLYCSAWHGLVIVEDAFSAMRISELGYNVVALLGTSLKEEYLLTIARNYSKVVLWLDDDEAGHRASAKLVKQMRLFIKEVITITAKEPKLCFNHQIEKMLKPHSLRSEVQETSK